MSFAFRQSYDIPLQIQLLPTATVIQSWPRKDTTGILTFIELLGAPPEPLEATPGRTTSCLVGLILSTFPVIMVYVPYTLLLPSSQRISSDLLLLPWY